MKRTDHKKQSVGKVVTGMLLGSVVGAVVAWLTIPAFGAQLRRRLAGEIEIGNRRYAQHGNPHPIPEVSRSASRRSLQEKIKTSEGNVESRARELVDEVGEDARDIKTTVFHHRNTTST